MCGMRTSEVRGGGWGYGNAAPPRHYAMGPVFRGGVYSIATLPCHRATGPFVLWGVTAPTRHYATGLFSEGWGGGGSGGS